MRKIVKKDLNDKRITDICNSIHYLHKDESVLTDTYIEYEILSKKYSDYAGDDNIAENYLIQVDIFSKSNFIQLEEIIEIVLKEKGYRFVESVDLYEDDIKLYHLASKYRYKKIKAD